MGKAKQNGSSGSAGISQDADKEAPRSLSIARAGIKTSTNFADFMSALMSDLVEGKVTPQMGNAACNAGGKLLKMVDMTYKYGSATGHSEPRKTLTIAFEEKAEESKKLPSEEKQTAA